MSILNPENGRVAKLWHKNGDAVICDLSPRHCSMKEGQKGFCGVRMNHGGNLVTVNYGRSVSMTEEVIETEAVYHYAPGSKILSLGNIGCMMNCDFCQNWETSQVRKMDQGNIVEYTPEQIVESAIKRGIKIISWTYNDPVVWHEFIMDTARLAKKNGLINLYKSAFYITEEAVEELCEVIDIFSISLKSMNAEFYRKITKAELEPVLKAIKLIAKKDIHLEISQLVITDLNDSEQDARETARWVAKNIGVNTPLHFVRFHPNYKYMHVDRTDPEALYIAQKVAVEEGMKYVYIGNLYEEEVADTLCPNCGDTLIERFGAKVTVHGISDLGRCIKCQEKISVVMNQGSFSEVHIGEDTLSTYQKCDDINFRWEEDVNGVHLNANSECKTMILKITHFPSKIKEIILLGHEHGVNRAIVSKSAPNDNEIRIKIHYRENDTLETLGVLDRAHFPIRDTKKGVAFKKPNMNIRG